MHSSWPNGSKLILLNWIAFAPPHGRSTFLFLYINKEVSLLLPILQDIKFTFLGWKNNTGSKKCTLPVADPALNPQHHR